MAISSSEPSSAAETTSSWFTSSERVSSARRPWIKPVPTTVNATMMTIAMEKIVAKTRLESERRGASGLEVMAYGYSSWPEKR